MDAEYGWANLMPSDWLVSKTFPFITIHDLRSLRAVNTNLKSSIDLFVDSLPGNFQAIFGMRAFSVLASYLSMNDFCNLNVVSKGCRFSVRVYSTSLPRDVRALVSAWCEEHPSALLIYSLQCFQPERPELVLYHPPFLKLSLGPMTFDKGKMKLKGQPLEEIRVNNFPPLNLGRTKPFVCETNDSGSEIFYCGGESFVEGYHDETWLSPIHVNHAYSATSGLFDTKTGLWRELPPMPEPRSGGVACRIGRRVLIFGGIKPLMHMFGVNLHVRPASDFVFVFDLDEERWITDHGFEDFQGGNDEHECQAAVAVDTDKVVIIRRQQVLLLNTKSKEWNQLPHLPMRVGAVIACHTVTYTGLLGAALIAVGKRSWAKLVILYDGGGNVEGTQWELEPDLRALGLKMMRFHRNTVQVFSGNSWEWMASDDITRHSFYEGHLFTMLSNQLPAVGFVKYTLN
ncbi:hypothetical protein HJC23_006426 [Cyclotella cryptica]|uniref:F-box domain-containing protein n=1 Tax=Cyclotella cryptica TaxID=29204 RepID=A0ABD3QUT4_9STRA|eukprot:CCRYP_001833-RA/>CCRYP_001833-RA protein AED:0.11 eAED:0.11 QI:0/-1/0/1/-1/1/1/0/456